MSPLTNIGRSRPRSVYRVGAVEPLLATRHATAPLLGDSEYINTFVLLGVKILWYLEHIVTRARACRHRALRPADGVIRRPLSTYKHVGSVAHSLTAREYLGTRNAMRSWTHVTSVVTCNATVHVQLINNTGENNFTSMWYLFNARREQNGSRYEQIR